MKMKIDVSPQHQAWLDAEIARKKAELAMMTANSEIKNKTPYIIVWGRKVFLHSLEDIQRAEADNFTIHY